MSHLKMYILLLDDLSTGHAVLAASHASLACYKAFEDDPDMQAWIEGTFYKVICRVTHSEFERACREDDRVILTESSLGNREVAVAFKPRQEWPKMFRFLRLYRDTKPSKDPTHS